MTPKYPFPMQLQNISPLIFSVWQVVSHSEMSKPGGRNEHMVNSIAIIPNVELFGRKCLTTERQM